MCRSVWLLPILRESRKKHFTPNGLATEGAVLLQTFQL